MTRIDRVAFALLVPLWALVLVLSFASIGRDIVESPVRVHGAETEAAYPTVTSLLPFAVRDDDPRAEPRPGDVLIRVGDVDVRGASGPRAISLVWAAMTPDGAVELSVEREGERLAVTGRIPTTISKWPGLVISLVFGGLAIFGLRRFPDLRISRLAFPALMATALFMGARFGTTPHELLAAFFIQAGSLLFLQPLTVRVVRFFPDGQEGALWARGWPWLFGLNGLILVDTVLFDRFPAPVADLGNLLITVVAPLTTLAVGIDRYRASNRTNRRRFKWLLLGVLIASLPGIVVGFASAIRPELGQWFMPGQLGQLAIPICLWIAIARHDLFDIDRVLNVAAVTLAAFVTLGLAAVAAGPRMHAALVDAGEVSASTAVFLLVFGALVVIGPLAIVARMGLDRWTLAQRREREAGVERLLSELSRADKLREVGARLTQDVRAIWNARGAALHVRIDGVWTPVSRDGELPEALDPDLDGAATLAATARSSASDDQGILRDPQQPLVARLSGGRGLEGAIVLGTNRSGDPYEERDRVLFAVVAERVAAVLAALEHREVLDHARALNHELTEGKRQAEAESAEKTALLASATHDLRQPLQALRLFLGSLGERVEGTEDRGLVEKAQLSAIAMQQQFEALLDESRLDAGSVRAQLQPVPLDEVLAEIHGFLEPLAAQKGLRLDVDGGGLAVQSDPSLLRSVLQNLVGNAIRYTEQGGVSVQSVATGGRVAIDVTDSGRGMDEDELQHLFEAGRRGRSASGESEGAGLGLSIVSRLCKLIGHSIRIRSKRGTGTTITVEADAATLDVRTAVPLGAATSPLVESRIVVIDDDDDTREAVARLVRGWGAAVVAGTTAKAVLEASPGFAPDAALLDFTLEHATGLDALAELEQAWGPLPAAILTGETDAQIVARVRESGLPLLRKPAAPVQIRAVLSSLVTR